MDTSSLSAHQINVDKDIEEINSYEKIQYYLLSFFRRKLYLYEKEVIYCCQKLLIFNNFLNASLEVDKLDIEKLRVDFVKITYYIIEFKLLVRDREKTMKIEHYLQHDNLQRAKLEEFIKNFKL